MVVEIFGILYVEVKNMDEAQWQMGMRIRNLREERHLTREQFSEDVEISPQFLYAIESGQKGISANTLARICHAFHVSSDYILFGESFTKVSDEIMHSINELDTKQLQLIAGMLNIILSSR